MSKILRIWNTICGEWRKGSTPRGVVACGWEAEDFMAFQYGIESRRLEAAYNAARRELLAARNAGGVEGLRRRCGATTAVMWKSYKCGRAVRIPRPPRPPFCRSSAATQARRGAILPARPAISRQDADRRKRLSRQWPHSRRRSFEHVHRLDGSRCDFC